MFYQPAVPADAEGEVLVPGFAAAPALGLAVALGLGERMPSSSFTMPLPALGSSSAGVAVGCTVALGVAVAVGLVAALQPLRQANSRTSARIYTVIFFMLYLQARIRYYYGGLKAFYEKNPCQHLENCPPGKAGRAIGYFFGLRMMLTSLFFTTMVLTTSMPSI